MDQASIKPPRRTLGLSVPPAFIHAVLLLTRGPLRQLSQVLFPEPYPSPKPNQKPWRVCGYCAEAALAATTNKAPKITTQRMFTLMVSPPVTQR